MRYEINPESFEIQIFEDGKDIPSIIQPNYPNQDTFDSVEEATVWAEAMIAAATDESAPNAPIGKGIPGKAKPTPEEIAEYESRIHGGENNG